MRVIGNADGGGVTERRQVRAARSRRGAVVLLTVLAMIGVLIGGVSAQDPWIRWPALVLAVGAAAGSLAVSRKRNSLIGWYVATSGVLLYRLINDLVI